MSGIHTEFMRLPEDRSLFDPDWPAYHHRAQMRGQTTLHLS
ncbi:MAG: hypothetical protein ACQEVT_10725 [Pseudomonadota bacterium]|nr:hypothetical protein [Roseovarius sp. EGI FJ00037]MCZ0812285.1 hypothetical protein [Roseovarius sp. EGI FJ00037]